MEPTFGYYSFQNIPIPNKHLYKLMLLKTVENVISNMIWKAYFFLAEPKEYKKRMDLLG